MLPIRRRFIVQGQVQGVGFRPFVFTQAEDAGLTGCVRNSPRGVVIEVQGTTDAAERFAEALQTRLPPLARIVAVQSEECPVLPDESGFVIAPSLEGDTHAVLISPDTTVCADCLADIRDPGNRRHGYPFTNCTNCGPRYTITRSIPYDRATTSMACFPMCPDCRAEYENPRDRRFHAQPNACPICGPQVWFVPGACARDAAAQTKHAVPTTGLEGNAYAGDAAIRALARHLVQGGIAAVKGLGGFHLACDACNTEAVTLLRTRKHRPHKPFAVMAASLAHARHVAHIGTDEEALLTSLEHPIVVCDLRAEHAVSHAVSPDTRSVGIMLPYTPMHQALMEAIEALRGDSGLPAVLVMTSGNPGGEPICLGNREALERLSSMADAFLLHNRDILIRVDDSVVRPLPGRGTLIYRRARGYVPRPTSMAPLEQRTFLDSTASDESSFHGTPSILGVGAELKNTLCLTKGDDAFVSQHIGDMANVETAAFHTAIRSHLANLLKVRPAVVVRDAHPDYLSSRQADDYAAEAGIPIYRVQHHVAHAHAVLAEHRFQGRAIVLALDGTGLGEDGHLWGGEALLVDTDGPLHRRVAHCAPLDLPGGETAIREPWRIAHALLLYLGMASDAESQLPWLPEYADAAALLPVMLRRRLNTPVSTSCGRLFDAVSALLGLCINTSYEGQAAIRLEEAQYTSDLRHLDSVLNAESECLPCPIREPNSPDTPLCLDTHAFFAALAEKRFAGASVSLLARSFHHSLAQGLTSLAQRLATEYAVQHIGLSGGCLQNRTLALLLARNLEQAGLTPLMHKALPPGDGCISFGQAAWMRWKLSASLE